MRIGGPSVWIELAMQNGIAIPEPHIHSVWRDRTPDYGAHRLSRVFPALSCPLSAATRRRRR